MAILRDRFSGEMVTALVGEAIVGPYSTAIAIDTIVVNASPGPVEAAIYDGLPVDAGALITSTQAGDADSTTERWLLNVGELLVVRWTWTAPPTNPWMVAKVYGTSVAL